MKIAVSGAHRVGKSTFVSDLQEHLPGYRIVDEPYLLLQGVGHVFAQPPTIEDFELQLERSIVDLMSTPAPAMFDRCPVDLLAYLAVHRDHDSFDPGLWISRVREAMEQIGLIVLVPIEDPDRIDVSPEDRPKWRRRVDEEIRELLLDDPYDLGVDVVEVRGGREERVAQVMRYLKAHRQR